MEAEKAAEVKRKYLEAQNAFDLDEDRFRAPKASHGQPSMQGVC